MQGVNRRKKGVNGVLDAGGRRADDFLGELVLNA